MQVFRYRCLWLLVCRFVFRSNMLGRHPFQRIILRSGHGLLSAVEVEQSLSIDVLVTEQLVLISRRYNKKGFYYPADSSMKASIGLD